MPELVLYQYEECGYCQRVLRAIDAMGIGDRVELRNTRTNSTHRAELVKLTGRTQVPCLVIDGRPMLESLDIIAWLKKNVEGQTLPRART